MKNNIKALCVLLAVASAVFAFLANRQNQRARAYQEYVSFAMPMVLDTMAMNMHYHTYKHRPKEWLTLEQGLADIGPDGWKLRGAMVSLNGYSAYTTGHDAWGSKIVFKKGAGQGEWILRSLGPNRRDEGGGGDDIEVSMVLYFADAPTRYHLQGGNATGELLPEN